MVTTMDTQAASIGGLASLLSADPRPLAAKNSNTPGLKTMLYAGSDQPLTSDKTLAPSKHVVNDCEPAAAVQP
jgi:hypothetical protein